MKMEKRRYKKRKLWNAHAEQLLLVLWAEKISALRSAKKNGHIVEEMASILQNEDINVSAEEVKTKLQNWTIKYRNEKNYVAPSDWEHFSKVQKILSCKINKSCTLTADSFLYEEMPTDSQILQSTVRSNSVCSETTKLESDPLSPIPKRPFYTRSCASLTKSDKERNLQEQFLNKIRCMETRTGKQEPRTEKIGTRRYKKRKLWDTRAEQLLLELWAEKIHALRNAKKNRHIIEEMASILQNEDINVSAEEVKTKLQNWSVKYKNEKRKIRSSGGTLSNWEHYNKVQQILGSFKINKVSTPNDDSFLYEERTSSGCSDKIVRDVDPLSQLPSPEQRSCSRCSASVSKPDEENHFQKQLLNKMEAIETRIEKQHKEMTEIANKMLDNEKRTCNLLEELVKSTVDMKKTTMKFLKKA